VRRWLLNETPLRVPPTTKIIVGSIQEYLTVFAELRLSERLVNLSLDKLETDLSKNLAINRACFDAASHSDKTRAGVLDIVLGPARDASAKFGARRIRLEELFLSGHAIKTSSRKISNRTLAVNLTNHRTAVRHCKIVSPL
jgi:hypothetical protein